MLTYDDTGMNHQLGLVLSMFILGLVTGYTALNESGLLAIAWGAITLTCLSSAIGLVSTNT